MFIAIAAIELLLTAVAVVGGLFLFAARAGASPSSPRPKRLTWSTVMAPLLITFASTQFAYSSGYYPWISPIAHVGLGVGVLVGIVLFSVARFRSWLARLAATCGYAVLLSVACLLVAVFTASGNGDSL
jgi:ABC-type transport system involved in cytochrome c biogenesis permease subunit